ncbi:MAG: hypothetical protein A2068_01055 [Ignavibacteria bacterium GWB2_35_6b]|nr:MAG: hypothetical protein A2068_01055 [Ignavibacteria bacterium GWB2_35_6b]
MFIYSITQILFYLGFVVWIFPAIRQFRGRFFFYFFILAVADPLTIILVLLFNINVGPMQPFLASALLVISVLDIQYLKENKYYVIIALTIVFIVALVFNNATIYFSVIVLFHIFIFYYILILFIKKNVDEKAVNFFYIVLMLYELTNILKISNLAFEITNADEYHTLTSIFQVAIGLYFSLFRENSTRNFIKLQ